MLVQIERVERGVYTPLCGGEAGGVENCKTGSLAGLINLGKWPPAGSVLCPLLSWYQRPGAPCKPTTPTVVARPIQRARFRRVSEVKARLA